MQFLVLFKEMMPGLRYIYLLRIPESTYNCLSFSSIVSFFVSFLFLLSLNM